MTTPSSNTALSSTLEVFGVIVEADIVPERIDEFLDLIEKDAVGSRAEPGCLRFGKNYVVALRLYRVVHV